MALNKYLTPFLLIALFVFSLPAMANTGRIVYMTGDVQVNGQAMNKSYRVKAGDKITTGANGKVNIVMQDKSILDLQPNTKFQLERFSFNKKAPEKSHSIMSLLSGSFRYISGLVGRTNHENATIKMGTATAGIRGSVAEFMFNGKKVEITTLVGQTTLKIGGRTFSFKAGTTARTGPGGKVAEGKPLPSQQQLLDAMNAVARGEVPTGVDPEIKALMLTAVASEQKSLGKTDAEVQSMARAILTDIKATNKDLADGAAVMLVAVLPTNKQKRALRKAIIDIVPKADLIDKYRTDFEGTRIEKNSFDSTIEYNEADGTPGDP